MFAEPVNEHLAPKTGPEMRFSKESARRGGGGGRTGTRRPRLAAGAAAVMAAALALTGCNAMGDFEFGGDAAPTPAPRDGITPALAAAIADIEKEYDGTAGVSIAAPGATTDDEPVISGDLTEDVAWSTVKVPIAVASVRATGDAPGYRDYITSAIAASDNDASDVLWASLGDTASASEASTKVLRDGGDLVTEVQGDMFLDQYVAYGDTVWGLDSQAVFGSNLPCIEDSGPVLEAMGEIADEQSYGLGTIDGARFKGGWGPDEDGSGYLVRQFGVVPSADGHVGVSIAARSGDGSYDTGQEMLNEIAAAVMANLPTGGACA